MHKFLRAIGFSAIQDRSKLKDLLTDVIQHSDERAFTTNDNNVMLGEFRKNYADGMGIAVCGEFDEKDQFIYNYYYPYLQGTGITSTEDVSVERHASRDSYSGVCEDMKLGISLIFYLRNMIPYVREETAGRLPVRGTTLTLSGLAGSGMILFPLHKDEGDVQRVREQSANRIKLMAAARQGDEDAIETLTMEEMDTYSTVSRMIRDEDIFTLVDTYFMPYGVECDQYSVLGEITAMRLVTNDVTGEQVYLLTICCNELTFDVCINIMDLFGEPQVGRRFKGNIWLQGYINFPA